ncbi:cysteine methyltransferase [Nonlabens spongiae]|uniref:Cysteine methyltransferase n=1 Tax=Nonlabens spongiae TaxID=331648 RepID=A0A1W6MLZ8_9FLAO|nr:MGMT family protein [Nonlabens spongiae]ARN78634.1 cysteine methyltransferase [Nonlabens spongiae]
MEKDFFLRVYEVVAQVPCGRVTSYGLVARYLGAPRSSRVVGYAMTAAVDRDDIPTHRVVNRIGVLTGKHHFPGTNLMQQLLESEGVKVVNDQIQEFDQIVWDPTIELKNT